MNPNERRSATRPARGGTRSSIVILAAVALLLQAPPVTLSQNGMPESKSAGSFSTFSTPQNLGPILNTTSNDELPVIAPSGLSLYFASDRAGGSGGRDIYVAQRATLSSAWGVPQNVGALLNTTSNDSPTSISPDGRELFFNSARAGGIGGVDIWLSTRTDPNNDLGWTAPVNLGAAVNTTLTDQNANYFVNPVSGAGGLFLASDRSSGTAGVKDIYQSTRNPDGSFNTPTLVNELNSAVDDARTAISRDGLEIFLSSNRLEPATTNQLMFVSTRSSVSAPWNAPVPVYGLNAGGLAPQPSLSADGMILYFVSNRAGGSGLGDLYSVNRISVNRSSPADFDGDGRSDISVFRPGGGDWYVLESGTNTFRGQHFGAAGDRIVPGDYDGDGRLDLAIFRPSTSVWWISNSSNGSISATTWGLSTDKPVPGDYDGDGKTDVAVFRDGTWYIVQSSDGLVKYQTFGLAGDVPIAAPNL